MAKRARFFELPRVPTERGGEPRPAATNTPEHSGGLPRLGRGPGRRARPGGVAKIYSEIRPPSRGLAPGQEPWPAAFRCSSTAPPLPSTRRPAMARVVHQDWGKVYRLLPEGRELGGRTGRGASLGNSKKQDGTQRKGGAADVSQLGPGSCRQLPPGPNPFRRAALFALLVHEQQGRAHQPRA